MSNKQKQNKAKRRVEEAEAARQRVLVKDKIYPILLKNAKNIEDAKLMLAALANAMQTAYTKKILELQTQFSKDPVSMLGLDKSLLKGKQFDRDKELLAVLQDETLGTATSLLEGLQAAISAWVKKESLERGLDTLKTDFL